MNNMTTADDPAVRAWLAQHMRCVDRIAHWRPPDEVRLEMRKLARLSEQFSPERARALGEPGKGVLRVLGQTTAELGGYDAARAALADAFAEWIRATRAVLRMGPDGFVHIAGEETQP